MKKIFFTLLLGLIFTQISLAHSPFLSCESQHDNIQCTGGFSDGSSTAGVKITVLDYSDETISEGQLDKEEKLTFDKPEEEEFYIKFDAGPGHVFEVDHVDVKEQEEGKEENKVEVPKDSKNEDAKKVEQETAPKKQDKEQKT